MQDIANRLKSNFKELHFEEARHLYTVDGKILPSVSGLIKKFHKAFPQNAAANYAKSNGLTEEFVKATWKETSDEACARGHRVHNFGELYPFDRTLKPSCKQEDAVKKFWDELPPHLSPVTMELRMFHKIFGYAGTADIILYNSLTNKLVIADYKTNKDLFKNFRGQTLINGFEHLLDCPFNKYQLQLSFYQILLEQTGYQVEGRRLIYLKKDGEYENWALDNYTEELTHKLAA